MQVTPERKPVEQAAGLLAPRAGALSSAGPGVSVSHQRRCSPPAENISDRALRENAGESRLRVCMDSACPRSSADRIGDLLCLLATSLSGGRQNYKDNIKRNIQKEHHSNNDRVTHMALRNRYGESASEKRRRDDAPHRDSPCPQRQPSSSAAWWRVAS